MRTGTQDQLEARRLNTSEQSADQVVHVVCRSKIPSYKMLVDSSRIFVLYRFISYRFVNMSNKKVSI